MPSLFYLRPAGCTKVQMLPLVHETRWLCVETADNAESENSLSSYVSSGCKATVRYMLVKDEDHHRLQLTLQ